MNFSNAKVVASVAWLMAASASLGPARAASQSVDFAHGVLPILQDHSAKCHTNGVQGDVSLDTRVHPPMGAEKVVASAESAMIERVTGDDPDQMPPKGPRLSKDEVDVLRRWIDAGVPWQEGFSFARDEYEAPVKPRRPKLPLDGASNPIDRIVFPYWSELGDEPPHR